jgi:hypothetical protein
MGRLKLVQELLSVSVHKWPFPAISASIGGIACAAYQSTPPRNAADFLELTENCSFLDRKRFNALNETVDGHYQCPSIKSLFSAGLAVVAGFRLRRP